MVNPNLGRWRVTVLVVICAAAMSDAPHADIPIPQTVTALWTSTGQHLDLFATDTNGAAISTWWERGCGWQPWFAIEPASGQFQPGQAIAAVWNAQHLDLFATDKSGRVVSTWWEGPKSWQPWFAIGADSAVAAPGQPVTPVWNGATHLDLFITDREGRVASTWWEPTRSWQPWFRIHPESARGAPAQEVTALWNGGHLDLFMTDDRGRVVSTWWESSRGWQSWFAIQPESGLAAPGQPVTAVWAPGRQHLDLFIVDRSGRVLSTWWESARGWQPWFAIHPEMVSTPKQKVTALWSNPGHLDLFVSSANRQVRSTWWEAASAWQPWFAIQPSTLQVKSPQTVTALWNGTGHLDLFATGTDGAVASTWWEARPSWQPWFRIFPAASAGRFHDPRNVVTQGFDNHRTGAFPAERILTPQTVASGRFGRLYARHVEGQLFAQPLYLRDVETRSQGRKNLLLLATTANRVYAFDADNTAAADAAALVASRQLRPSAALMPNAGNTSVNLCDQTFPYFFGITATPVIDPVTDTMYVVAYDTSARINAQKSGQYFLHALNLRDGLNDRVPPRQISADGFLSHTGRNRPGLLLMNGVVYVAFGSFICDHPLDYSGWVFGYHAEDLSPAGTFRTDPSLKGAGIWQSGRGLVGDGGSVYFMTGNENAQTPRDDSIANSFVKLNASCSALTPAGRFTPSNSVELSLGDTDLGSSGPLLLPGKRLIGGGKQGRVYVLDSDNMTLSQNQKEADGFQGSQFFENTWRKNLASPCAANADALCRKRLPGTYPFPSGGQEIPGVDCNVPQTDPRKAERCSVINGWRSQPGCFLPVSCYQFDQGMGPNIHAGFVYWHGYPDAGKGRLYALPEKEYLKAFEYDVKMRRVVETPVAINQQIRIGDGMPGGALSVSSDGNRNGIVWVTKHEPQDAMMRVHPGHFYAVDASNFQILWEEGNIEFFAKFNPPIVADGKVVLPTWGRPDRDDPSRQTQAAVVVYGLRQTPPAQPAPTAPARPRDTLAALAARGVDFSVAEAEVRGWINNSYTPYPAISAALLRLLKDRPLRQPVHLDVIVWNYENAPGASSPRRLGDVDLGRLKAAVVQSYNSRYGENAADFQQVLR